jgi:uncharacterized membrane protein YccC
VVDRISEDDRTQTLRWVKVGTVLLVGLSSGLVSLQGDASVESAAIAVGVGLLVGTGLVWYLFPDRDSIAPASGRRYG